MQHYEYECPSHGTFLDPVRADSVFCADITCTNMAQRRWGFSYRPFPTHYNPSVGMTINSPSQLRSELSRQSDIASSPSTVYDADGSPHVVERPPTNFQPVDIRDRETLGVTNEGLDSTYNALRAQGRDTDAKKLKGLMDE